MEPANDNKVSPFAWLSFGWAALCDLFKILLFFFNAIPVAGTAIDAGGSFFVSLIEILGSFGGLYLLGFYKGKNGTRDALITMGMSTFDLIPILDDLPLTSPSIGYMLIKKYAAQKLAASAPTNDNDADEEQRAA